MHPIVFVVLVNKGPSTAWERTQNLNYLYKKEKNSCFYIIHMKGFTFCFPFNVCMSLHIIKKRKLILIMLQHRRRDLSGS